MTILLDPPNLDDVQTEINGTESFENAPDSVSSTKQDEVGVDWGGPQDPSVERIYFGVGTDDDNDKVCSSNLVGFSPLHVHPMYTQTSPRDIKCL